VEDKVADPTPRERLDLALEREDAFGVERPVEGQFDGVLHPGDVSNVDGKPG
jgi:hypothetical protein